LQWKKGGCAQCATGDGDYQNKLLPSAAVLLLIQSIPVPERPPISLSRACLSKTRNSCNLLFSSTLITLNWQNAELTAVSGSVFGALASGERQAIFPERICFSLIPIPRTPYVAPPKLLATSVGRLRCKRWRRTVHVAQKLG